VYPGSTPEAIDDAVAGFFDLPSAPVAPNAWFEEQFNAENQTRILDSILRSLHEEPLREIIPSPEPWMQQDVLQLESSLRDLRTWTRLHKKKSNSPTR
jgi:hypothetical protein